MIHLITAVEVHPDRFAQARAHGIKKTVVFNKVRREVFAYEDGFYWQIKGGPCLRVPRVDYVVGEVRV